MPVSDFIFATDRKAEVYVYINGELIGSGFSADDSDEGNITSITTNADVDAMPPTAIISLKKAPAWIARRMTVDIDAGYNGELARIFTGRVAKRPRHGPRGDTIDCEGRTAKLTRPYRIVPKPFLAIGAKAAIIDILDDDGVRFTPAYGEQYDIDDALNDWTIGTVRAAYMDRMSATDMIRKIADVDGNRAFETRGGTLRIRPLLEAPAPSAFRTYGTSGASTSASTTDEFDDINIDTALAMGDAASRERRGQGVTPTADGNTTTVSLWLKKVGAPTDFIQLWLYADNGGKPSTQLLGGSPLYSGQLLDTVDYTQVELKITSGVPLVSGTVYHIVVDRSGAIDAANYYTVGAKAAGGYAGGASSLFNGASWSAATSDIAFALSTVNLAGLRILDVGDDEDPSQIKKQIIVTGALLEDTDAEGNVTQSQVYQEAVTLDDSLEEGDPEFFSGNYQNDLIQDNEKAAEVALRLLDKYHRVLDSIEVSVPFDPEMDLGITIGINDPEVTGRGGNWWVRAYSHTLTAASADTQISLFGGDQSGTTGLVRPRAEFTWRAERELIGNGIRVVITFDGKTSIDADGVVVNYHWTDTYAGGAMDEEGPHLAVITRTYDPAVDPEFTVSLEVMDDSGLTDTITHTFRVSDTNEDIFAPVISCAAGNRCMATFDGGQSWMDIATPSGNAVVTAIHYDANTPSFPMTILFGTDNGRIYRSDDGMVSLTREYTDVDGDPITSIVPDIVRRGIIYATTTDRVLRSIRPLNTWSVYTDFNDNNFRHGAGHVNPGNTDPRPINGLLVSDPSVNRLWIFGGRGDVVESWFGTNYIPEGGTRWFSEISEGSGVAAFPRDAADTVVDAVVSHATSGDLGLMFRRAGGAPANPYIYASPFYPVGAADWQFGGGAMIGANADGVGAEVNHAEFQQFGAVLDNKNFYVSNNGVAFWPLVDVLPGTAANRPHHLISVLAWKDIYLAAMDEGIAKSADGGLTWNFLRPMGAPINTTWPVGAIGRQVAIAYRRPVTFGHGLMVSVYDDAAAKTATLIRQGSGEWTKQSEDVVAYQGTKIHSFSGLSRLFRTRTVVGFYSGADWQTLQYSDDLGVTWNNTTVARCPDVALAANGDLFAISAGADAQPHFLFRSIDGGDTWAEVYEDTTLSGTYSVYRRLACDPLNANRLAMVGWDAGGGTGQALVMVLDATLGAGATFTRTEPTFSKKAEKTNMSFTIGQSGRLVLAYENSAGQEIRVETSDDDGLTWDLRLTKTSSGNEHPRILFRAGQNLYLMHASSTGLLRSTDNGVTWTPFPLIDTAVNLRGVDWDSTNDILYAGERESGGVGEDAFTANQMLNPLPAGTWTDISDGIEEATGFTRNKLCNEGITVARG